MPLQPGDCAGAYVITDILKAPTRHVLQCRFCGSIRTTSHIESILRASGTRCKKCPPKPRSEVYRRYYTAKKLGDPGWLSKKSKTYRDSHLESRRKDSRVHHHKRKARAKTDPELAARIKAASAACWRKCDPVSKRLWTLKERAAKKNVPFDLDKEYLSSIIPDTCPVLGEPIHFNSTRASRWSVSVDRIVPELGYVRGNIMVMSKLANCMKQDATPEELIKFAHWVLSTYAH